MSVLSFEEFKPALLICQYLYQRRRIPFPLPPSSITWMHGPSFVVVGWPLQAFGIICHGFHSWMFVYSQFKVVPFPTSIVGFRLLDFILHVFVSYLLHAPYRDPCLPSLLDHAHLCVSAIIDGLMWRWYSFYVESWYLSLFWVYKNSQDTQYKKVGTLYICSR